MDILSKGNLFPHELVTDIYTKVGGHSTLAKLSAQTPVSFVGNDIFVFNMPGEIGIVAENAKKPAQGLSLAPVSITPIKVVYQGRVSDEFMHASEERQIDMLDKYSGGFVKKLGSGLDKMYIQGINPLTGTKSDLITSYFDKDVTKTVTYTAANGGDAAIEDAIQLLGEVAPTGLALNRTFAAAMAKETEKNGVRKFPELAWGGNPASLRALRSDVNTTLGKNNAIVGDFERAFVWGYAQDITFEVIEYGDPDNTGVDLKGSNQVCLRSEAYVGAVIIDPEAFVRIVSGT